MEHVLVKAILEAISTLYSLKKETCAVDFPSDSKFGDYTTNIALVIAKEIQKAPPVIAQEIVTVLKQNPVLQKTFRDITAVGGFVNFTLSQNTLTTLVSNDEFLKTGTTPSQRILVEYGQPNTHKLPHIGHLFSYIVGDSLARLFSATGNTVMKANYEGDIGPHVAKALYGWIQKGKPDPENPLERVRLLQTCYQEGSKAYEEDEIAKETIDLINKGIYNNDPEYKGLWMETRQWSVDYYAEFEKLLDVQQTFHYWESEIWERGKNAVQSFIGKVFTPSEGAIIFKGSEYGLHDRVFITKLGTPTYEAKDMGLNIQKYEDWKYDTNIITTASEQNAYFSVVIKAMELCYPELVGKIQHIGFGMVSLATGKMSSRTGNILSALDLIDEVRERVLKIMETREGLSEDEKKHIVQVVTLGAIKYAFLKQNILQNMKFDIEESISFEGKSGPYIQYTYARIQSVLAQKAETPTATSKDWEALVLPTELSVMRQLAKYSTIVQKAAQQRAPHHVAEYLNVLAQEFNSFYTQSSINSAESEELLRARRTLAAKVAKTLKNGLALLGIAVVEKM